MLIDIIKDDLLLTYKGDEIIFPADINFIVITPISDFMDLFGDVIQQAIENDIDPIQAIKDSDPENLNGFNGLLF